MPDIPRRSSWSLLACLGLAGVSPAQTDLPRAAALAEGQSLHPWLSAGERQVATTLRFDVPDDGRYRFVLETSGGRGTLSLADWGGAPVSTGDRTPWLDLSWGEVTLDLRFEGEPGASAFRILWERHGDAGEGFPPEPLPSARVLSASAPWAGAGHQDVSDRWLLEKKGCTNCHQPSAAQALAVGRRPGPDLAHVAAGTGRAWLQRWLDDPAALRPGADMPALLHAGAQGDREAILAFLASLAPAGGAPAEDEALATEADVLARGRALYHGVGCVACHGPLESARVAFGEDTLPDGLPAADEAPVAPFGDLAGKWAPSALAAFLRDPLVRHPDGRMPSLALDAGEADLVATYLLSRWGAAAAEDRLDPAPAEARVAAGRERFRSQGCVACHAVEGIVTRPATPLASLPLQGGCLDPADAAERQLPRYVLSEGERAALGRAIASVQRAKGAPAPLDAAARTWERLSCGACHVRGTRGGPSPSLDPYFRSGDERVDLGEPGRLPPDLTDVGWKLTTPWLRAVLLEGERTRPYLLTRMPHYGAEHVAELPEAFAQREGVWPNTDLEHPQVTDADVLNGREMMGRTALSCVTCHSFRDYEPVGSPGPGLERFGERLRYEWYRAFLRAPQRFLPGSRMPDFAAGGKSTLTRIYDGDLQRQVDAMWAYFGLGEFMPAPEDVEVGRTLRVLVDDRPVVLRAFLEGSGSRAIAVGLPGGANFAFDAAAVRLSQVWQGEFLDAAGSWSGRGGTALGGRGPLVWSAPPGPPLWLALEGSDARPPADPGSLATGAAGGQRFRGYRLDAAGHPTFLYDVQGRRVQERVTIQVQPELCVRRVLRLSARGLNGVQLAGAASDHGSVRFRPADTGSDGPWEPLLISIVSGDHELFFVPLEGRAGAVEIAWEIRP